MRKVLFTLILSFLLLFPDLSLAQTTTTGICDLYSNFRKTMSQNHLELDKFFLNENEVKFELYSQPKGSRWVLIVVSFDPIKRPLACIVESGNFIMSGRTSSF